MMKKLTALLLAGTLIGSLPLPACGAAYFPDAAELLFPEDGEEEEEVTYELPVTQPESRASIEELLNLENNQDQTWTYLGEADAWSLKAVPAAAFSKNEVTGVSVCVPGSYVTGIDTDGDGEADVRAGEAGAVQGSLVIDREVSVTTPNGQVYTARTVPVILDAGAGSFGELPETEALAVYASYGFVTAAVTLRDESGADGGLDRAEAAPGGLVELKEAVRFVKYNIALGNLPGSAEHLVAVGSGDRGSLALLLAASSGSQDFLPYETDEGAAGVYRISDQEYEETVTIDGAAYPVTEGIWGCIAYGADASPAEDDMALAFEYILDPEHHFRTAFQEELAAALAQEYMQYINERDAYIDEAQLGVDLDGDGTLESQVNLTIEYSTELYPETNGYGGTYVELFAGLMSRSLQEYAGWTDEAANPLRFDEEASETESDYDFITIEDTYDEEEASDSLNYEHFDELLLAYQAEVGETERGDDYGNIITELYDASGQAGTGSEAGPVWTRLVLGTDGEIPLLPSLNLELALLGAGADAALEWQWNGGSLPSERFGSSPGLYIDRMYGRYEEGAVQIEETFSEAVDEAGPTQSGAEAVQSAGTDAEASPELRLSPAAAVACRSVAHEQAIPAFDRFDGGSLNRIFGRDGEERHWSVYVLSALEEHIDVLGQLFNGGSLLSEEELIAAAERAEEEAALFDPPYDEDELPEEITADEGAYPDDDVYEGDDEELTLPEEDPEQEEIETPGE